MCIQPHTHGGGAAGFVLFPLFMSLVFRCCRTHILDALSVSQTAEE